MAVRIISPSDRDTAGKYLPFPGRLAHSGQSTRRGAGPTETPINWFSIGVSRGLLRRGDRIGQPSNAQARGIK